MSARISFGTTNIDCLNRELQQALAAEALVGVLCCQMCTSSRREFHACTLAFRWILVLTNKRRTTSRTRLVFHSCLSYLSHDLCLSVSVMGRTGRQGLPTATTLSGMSFTTTEPPPMTTFEPIFTPGITCTPAPIHTLSPTVMG